MTAPDISTIVSFYTNVPSMTQKRFSLADDSTRHAVCFGKMKINLHQTGAEFEPNATYARTGSADFCFLTATPLGDCKTHLTEHKVSFELGPIHRSGATGPIVSIYLHDPDRNLIEESTSA